MTTATKTRLGKTEIQARIDEAEKLISNGTTKTQAAKEVGISYPTLARHLGEGYKRPSKNLYMDKFLENIRAEVKAELRRKVIDLLK